MLVTAGLTALVYGLVRSSAVGWTSWQTALALAAAAGLIAWFLVHESRGAVSPLMPIRMFARRSIWSANLVMFLLSGAIFAMWFFVSLYLQDVLAYSPLRTGFAFLPQTVAIVFGAQLSSRLILRIGPRPLLLAGAASTAAGLFWLGQVGLHSAYWADIFLPSVLITLGLGLSFTPLAYAATAGVAQRDAGLASGLVNTSRQIGGAIGLAALATVAVSRMDSVVRAAGPSLSHSRAVVAEATTQGYTEAFIISAFIAIAAMVAAMLVPTVRRRSSASVEAPSGELATAPVET